MSDYQPGCNGEFKPQPKTMLDTPMSESNLSPEAVVTLVNVNLGDDECDGRRELASIVIDFIESQARRIAELEQLDRHRERTIADLVGKLDAAEQHVKILTEQRDALVELTPRVQPETRGCPECSQYNVRYSVVMKDLQKLAGEISSGDCSHSHGLDCTTLIGFHFDKLKRQLAAQQPPPPTKFQVGDVVRVKDAWAERRVHRVIHAYEVDLSYGGGTTELSEDRLELVSRAAVEPRDSQ